MDKIEPANNVLFGDLCFLLEQLYKKKLLVQEKEKILSKYIVDFKCNAALERKNTSFYPILRLLVPSLERERGAYSLKEAKLGILLVKVLSLDKKSHDAQKLLNRALNSQDGDFGNVAYFVLKSRVSQNSCNLTVGDINDSLDKIASAEVGNKGPILDDLFSKIIRNLTPEQTKWFLRIILKDLKLGMSPRRILSCYHPDAPEHYDKFGNLVKVCEELEDGNVRPIELGIELFYAISPMLSERLDVTDIGELPKNRTYLIEEKFDGERFQIHMESQSSAEGAGQSKHVYEYFSRKGFVYANKFGRSYDSGLLTPQLKYCFSSHVASFVLDGEMMGWHKDRQCFGSKGMAFDVKKLNESSRFQPCFCAFDILYFNGRSLVGPPEKGGMKLSERLKLLDAMFIDRTGVIQHSTRKIVTQSLVGPPEKGGMKLNERLKLLDAMFVDRTGVIHHSTRKIVTQSSDILNALNKAIDNQDEGIVVKDTESYYIANKRNAGWYKIKPEYTDGVMDDMDLVIIGIDAAENRRQGPAKSFLIAVADSQPDVPTKRWVCVGRVATGLTYDQRESLCSALKRNWKLANLTPPPPELVFNKIKPNFWILPEHSMVLQVRATELIRSTDFGTPYTLRFARIKRLRDDKPVQDIMTLQEFNKLVESAGPVVKLSTKRVGEEMIGEAEAKTRKKRTSNIPQVPDELKKTSAGDVEVLSQALKGRKIFILSDDEDCSREELIRIVESHGGKVVASPGADTWCNIVGRSTYRARNLTSTGEADVAPASWLRALPPSPAPYTLTPLDLLTMKRETRLSCARDYDSYGDSYKIPATKETLKSCFMKMATDEPEVYLTSKEMMDLDRELFGEYNPFSFLRACSIHLTGDSNSILALRSKMFGAKICEIDNVTLTHVIVPNTMEESDVQDIKDRVAHRKVVVVPEVWLERCLLQEKLVSHAMFCL